MTGKARLTRHFFERPTLEVAQDLLGKVIHFNGMQGKITETEAYIAQGDPACHAYKGITPRTRVLFGPAGFSYVYFIYGMYHCLNFVTEPEGHAAAVLIRAIEMTTTPRKTLNGPGKLCRALGITREHNNIDLITSPHFYVLDSAEKRTFKATPRIGIKVATDKLWRFVVT
jgi:DNA-3-methyladenine glycosylase